MGQMVKWKDKLIRINPNPTSDSDKLQISADNGYNWCMIGNHWGYQFQDLMENGDEILATTSNGLFYSRDGGLNWNKRN